MTDDCIILVTAAGAPGLTPDHLRGPSWLAPSRGVRIRRDVADLDRAMVAAAVIGSADDGVLTDTAAAHWWGLPLPPWLGLRMAEHPVSVAVPAGRSRPQRRGVRGRRLALPPEHLTTHLGQPVTEPARTFVDCAQWLPPEHLVALGDAVLTRRLATQEELWQVAVWARGRRGVRRARWAIPLLDEGSESPGESVVRAQLLLGGLPRPRCNLNIYRHGVWLARVDLAWPQQRVIVEYDRVVHLQDEQRKRDARRRNDLLAAGWLVITFASADLATPWTMVGRVKQALHSRTRPATSPANGEASG